MDKTPKKLGQVYRARAISSTRLSYTPRLWHYQIDLARAQAFVYRFLAKAFSFPKTEDWRWLSNPTIHTIFSSAVRHLVPQETAPMRNLASQLLQEFHPGQFESFMEEHSFAFNSSEGRVAADHLFAGNRPACCRTQEFLFVESLLKEFGLEISEWPSKSCDLLCVGLEFMSWLLTREAELLEHQDQPQANLYREAQQKLLKRFLAARVAQLSCSTGGLLTKLVCFLKDFVQIEQHWTPRAVNSAGQRTSPAHATRAQ